MLARLELQGTVDLGGLSVTGATAGAGAANGELVLSGAINTESTGVSTTVDDVGLQLGGYAGAAYTGTLGIAESALTLVDVPTFPVSALHVAVSGLPPDRAPSPACVQ